MDDNVVRDAFMIFYSSHPFLFVINVATDKKKTLFLPKMIPGRSRSRQDCWRCWQRRQADHRRSHRKVLPNRGRPSPAQEPQECRYCHPAVVAHPRRGVHPPRRPIPWQACRLLEAARLWPVLGHRSIWCQRCPAQACGPDLHHRHLHHGTHSISVFQSFGLSTTFSSFFLGHARMMTRSYVFFPHFIDRDDSILSHFALRLY